MFIAGKSGNPNGRPKGTGKKQSISQVCQEYLEGELDGKKRVKIALEKLFNEDLKTLWAYAYGKPLETQMNVTPEDTQSEIEMAVARVLANRVSGQPEANQNAPESICERN